MSAAVRHLMLPDHGSVGKLRVNVRSALRNFILLIAIASCALVSCFRDEGLIIWSKDVQSPDGRWLAMAVTKQWSGPGGAYVGTNVYLKSLGALHHSGQVLGFSDETAYPSGVTRVTMIWITPNHLNVTYGSHADLDFQAIKSGGIDISVRKLRNP